MRAESIVEAGIVAESRAGVLGGDRLDKIIVELGLEIEPVTADQARQPVSPIDDLEEPVIASKAKQSMAPRKPLSALDCFTRFAGSQ